MKPSYFQNAQIEKTFERQCNCESKLNQLLWNEFLIITLPLICWSSPRVKEWPHTHFLWNGRFFFSFAAYHLEYSETKLFCLPWKYFSEQLFTYPWLISYKKWKVSLIFPLTKMYYFCSGHDDFWIKILICSHWKIHILQSFFKFIKDNIIKGALCINL